MVERMMEPDPEDVNDTMPVSAEAGGQAAAEPQGAAAEAQGAAAEPEAQGAAAEPEAQGAVADQWGKLLGTEEGQQSLNQLIDGLLAEEQGQIETEVKQAAQREKQKAVADSLAGAYKEAQESGDWSQYGEMRAKMDAQSAIMQRVASVLQPQIESRVTANTIDVLDNAVEGAFGDVLSQLTQDELQSLRRDNFDNDTQFYSAVMTGIRGKMESVIRAETGEAVQSAQTVAAAAQTARKARSDGLGVLPAGIGEAINRSSSIGELIRLGLGASAEGEDDSD